MKDVFKPIVTIFLLANSDCKALKESINSVLYQDYENIELVVLGNKLSSESKQLILSYSDKLSYFNFSDGFSVGRVNDLIKESKGSYVRFMNSGDILLENSIESYVACLSKVEDKNTILYSNYKFNLQEDIILEDLYEKRKLDDLLYILLNIDIKQSSFMFSKYTLEQVGFLSDFSTDVYFLDLLYKLYKSKFKISHISDLTFSTLSVLKEGYDEFIVNLLSNLAMDEFNRIDGNEFFVLDRIKERLKRTNCHKTLNHIDTRQLEIEKKNLSKYEIKPKISTVITCYNQADTIIRAIDSVVAQDYENIEVIVVNDGSTDEDTNKLLGSYSHPKVKIFRKENSGVSGARNFGLSKVTGDFIQLLDGDDELFPTKFTEQIEEFKKYPWIDISNSACLYDVNGEQGTWEKELYSLDSFKQFEDLLYKWQAPKVLALHSFLMKKKCFDNISFPLDLCINEDYLVWLEFSFKNYKFKPIEKILCKYNCQTKVGNVCADYLKVLYNISKAHLFIKEKYKGFFNEDVFDIEKLKYFKRVMLGYFEKVNISKKEDYKNIFRCIDVDSLLSEMVKKYTDKRIMLYGTGLLFEALLDYCDLSGLNIVAVTDKKVEEDTIINGYKAISVSKIREESPDVILITVLHSEVIEKFLIEEIYKDAVLPELEVLASVDKIWWYA